MLSSPVNHLSWSGLVVRFVVWPVPVPLRQREQWQWIILWNGGLTSNVTAPQRQLP
jgi:hypothetical protein